MLLVSKVHAQVYVSPKRSRTRSTLQDPGSLQPCIRSSQWPPSELSTKNLHLFSLGRRINQIRTKDSMEFNQRGIPSALASAQLIFPPHAFTHAPTSNSWLSLWNAQTISLYLNLSRNPVDRGIVVPSYVGWVGEEAGLLGEVMRWLKM